MTATKTQAQIRRENRRAGKAKTVEATPTVPALRTFTVTGDLGGFKMGQQLTDPSDVSAYYRLQVNEGAEAETTLSDAQIYETVCSVPGDDEDTEVERVTLLEGITETGDDVTGTEPQAAAPAASPDVEARIAADGEKRYTVVLSLATALNNDAIASRHIEEGYKAREAMNQAPVDHMRDLARVYGQAMNAFPRFGSTQKDATEHDKVDSGAVDTKGRPIMHYNLDAYMRPVKQADGTSPNKKVTFYGDLAANTTKGRECIRIINAIEGAAKGVPLPADIRLPTGEPERRAYKLMLSARVRVIKSNIVRGVRLWQQMKRLEQLCPLLGVDISELGGASNPVIVYKRGEPGKPILAFQTYSVPTFINYDIWKASQNGGTIEALEATGKKTGKVPGTGGAGADTASKVPPITSWAGASNYMSELTAYFGNKDNSPEIAGAMANMTDDECITNGDAILSLYNLFKARISLRYTNLQNRRAEQQNIVRASQSAADIAAITKSN